MPSSDIFEETILMHSAKTSVLPTVMYHYVVKPTKSASAHICTTATEINY